MNILEFLQNQSFELEEMSDEDRNKLFREKFQNEDEVIEFVNLLIFLNEKKDWAEEFFKILPEIQAKLN